MVLIQLRGCDGIWKYTTRVSVIRLSGCFTLYHIHLPLKCNVLFFHVISRCLVVDFSFTYFGRKKGGQNDTTTGYSLCARSFDFWYINNFWVKTLHACSSWSIRYVIPNYIIYWMFFPYFLSRICVQCTWMCWNLRQIFKTCYTCEKSWYEIFYSGAHQLFRLRFIPNRWKKSFLIKRIQLWKFRDSTELKC